MDNMDPRIRPSDGNSRAHNAPGAGSFKGKPLVVDPSIQKPKASGWKSVMDLIATPLHALRKTFSSKPYSKLSFEKLFVGEGSSLSLKRESLKDALQALGHSMREGHDDKGATLFRKKSWGLDYHLRDEFLSRKDGLAHLGHFRSALEKELYGSEGKKGLYQQYEEARANSKENPSFAPVVKDLEEQIAGAEILLRSHDNIVARELFWDVDEADIFNKIPLNKFLDIHPKDGKHYDLLKYHLATHEGEGDKLASSDLLNTIFGKCSRKNDWAFNGSQLLKVMPDEAIAEILYGKSPHEAQALLNALPRERREKIKDAFEALVLKDPATGSFRDPLVIAESILQLSDPVTLQNKPQATLLGTLAKGISSQEALAEGSLEEARAERDSAKTQHDSAKEALDDAQKHNRAIMKKKAETAALSMLDMKLSTQRRELESMSKKDEALQKKYKEKSAVFAELKISDSPDPLKIEKLEKEVKKLEAEVHKMRASRDKIAADVEDTDKRAQIYRDAIATAPDGAAHSKEAIEALEEAVKAADARVQVAEQQCAQLEAQGATGKSYNDVLVLTLVNLVLMLPAGEAHAFVTALYVNPDIKVDQETLENLDAIIEERNVVQQALDTEARLIRQAEEESLSGNPILLKDGTKLDDDNVAEVMGSFVKANKVDLSRPIDPDKHLVKETAKKSPKELLHILNALQHPISNVEHMLYLCDEAIAMEKDLGGSASKGLKELQQYYREQHYGLKILEKSAQMSIARFILGPQARPESLEELGADNLAERLSGSDEFKNNPARYIRLIAGVCGVSFAKELAEALTHVDDKSGDYLYPQLAGPGGRSIVGTIAKAAEALPEAIPYEARTLSNVDLSKDLGTLGLNLGRKHALKPEYIAYEMRRIAEEDIPVHELQKTLGKQLGDDTALVAYSKSVAYTKSLEAFITRLEVIAEGNAEINGKASESILKSIAGYKNELKGAQRFEEALKNIALPASVEEIMDDFTLIEGAALQAEPVQEDAELNDGTPPLTLFGKNLETMDDEALMARLSMHVSLNELSPLSDKSLIEYNQNIDVDKTIAMLEVKKQTFETALQDLRKKATEVVEFSGTQHAYRYDDLANQLRDQKLSQAIQGLNVLIAKINLDANPVVAEEAPQIEDITPVAVKVGDTQIDKSNEADLLRDVRLKYQSLPEGTEPTLENLGIIIEDDLGHSELKKLQAQLAVHVKTVYKELRTAWDDHDISEEEITLMAEAYSGLTILNRAVFNEMERLDLDYIGKPIDLWNFKPQPPVHIEQGVGA